MAVTAQTPVITYSASGSSAVFPYPFRILEAGDLKVYLNDVLTTSWYSIAGIGDESGGAVSFVSSPLVGTRVKLQRSVPRNRSTDYVEGGVLRAQVPDNDCGLLYLKEAMQPV